MRPWSYCAHTQQSYTAMSVRVYVMEAQHVHSSVGSYWCCNIGTSTLPCRPQPFASYQPVPCRIWDVVGRHGPVDFAASPGRSYISNHVARLGAERARIERRLAQALDQ